MTTLPALHENEYRVRPLADLEVDAPIKVRINCEVCDTREVVYVVEHKDEARILRRHLVCQQCRDRYGPQKIIVLLEDA